MDDRRPPHFMPSIKRETKVGHLKLDLPVDEDDYLMPSPQPTQTNGGYMDLIGDAKLGGQFDSTHVHLLFVTNCSSFSFYVRRYWRFE